MSKAKMRATPGPQSRAPAGKARDSLGRFVKGTSGNPGGRTQMPIEIKQLARELSLEGMQHVAAMMRREDTSDRDRLAAVRLMLEYGYGRPAAEFDRERLELEKRRVDADISRQDAGPRVIEVVFGEGAEDFAE